MNPRLPRKGEKNKMHMIVEKDTLVGRIEWNKLSPTAESRDTHLRLPPALTLQLVAVTMLMPEVGLNTSDILHSIYNSP